MWIVRDIYEADYGCEERMPGEPLLSCVVLEAQDGRSCRFEVADDWLTTQEIDVGDEWPEDIELVNDSSVQKQNEFMDNYFEALEELEDNL